MHFLTLTAVQIPIWKRTWRKTASWKNKRRSSKRQQKKTVEKQRSISVFRQWLEQFSATFSRAVDEAVAEQLEPFNTSTDDPNYLEFVDQTEELKREYEGTIDCIKLPQGKIVPARYGFYQNRFEIQNGKVFQRKAALPASPAAPSGPNGCRCIKTIRFKSCTEISGSLRRNGPLPTGTKNSKLTDITAIQMPSGTGIPLGDVGPASSL